MTDHKVARTVDIDHVSGKLSKEKIKELKLLYHHYFKKCKLQEWSRVRCGRIRRALDFGSLAVTAAGVIGGTVTANILIVAIVSTAGLVINGSSKLMNLKETEEAHANAHGLYLDLVIRLKSYLRGIEFTEAELMIDMATMDRLVGKSTPITKEKYSVRYDRKYEGYNSEDDEEDSPLASRKKGKSHPLDYEPKKAKNARDVFDRIGGVLRGSARRDANSTSEGASSEDVVGELRAPQSVTGVRRTSSAPTFASVMSELIEKAEKKEPSD